MRSSTITSPKTWLLLDDLLDRAERPSRKPLQHFAGLQGEAADELSGDDPGCLYASFACEREHFDENTREAIAQACRRWRDGTREKLDECQPRRHD